MRSLYHPISRLRDFTRSSCKTSVRLVNRGSGWYSYWHKPLIVFFTHQAPQILLQQPLAGRPEARPTRVRYGDSVCRRVCRQYDMKRLLHSLLVFGLRSPATRLLLHFFSTNGPGKQLRNHQGSVLLALCEINCRWISLTKGKWYEKPFYLMMLYCILA